MQSFALLLQRTVLAIGLAPISFCCLDIHADELSANFDHQLKPFLAKYCDSCHSGSDPEAKLDTSSFQGLSSVGSAWDSWQAMTTRVKIAEMPPADSDTLPTEEERSAFVAWTNSFRKAEAERLRDDPGPVSTRRLSNWEYNYTIRDITGVDIQPTKSFPIDPANEAGFDNSAESLTVSPALVSKYLDAARQVADHLLLTPKGIRFAPHPVVTDTDRDKYCVQRIVDFYLKQPTELDQYLFASWSVRNAIAIGERASDAIEKISVQHQLSSKYLLTVWNALNDESLAYGPMKTVRERFASLPTEASMAAEVESSCRELSVWIQRERKLLVPDVENLRGAGISGGSQTLVLWKNRKLANNRRSLREDWDKTLQGDAPEFVRVRAILESGSKEERQRVIDSYETFCSIFPDAFYIHERGRAHIDSADAAEEGKGRLLSAGFHSMMGYFRDDRPLCELILDEKQLHELDQLWHELDFIALAPIRQYSGFIWYERAESSFINEAAFNFVRAEDKNANSESMIARFADTYLGKAKRKNASDDVLEAVEFYFADMSRQIRKLEAELLDAEHLQLAQLVVIAEKAYRRPLTDDERDQLVTFYKEARSQPNASHRSAMEDTLVYILVSPNYLYRWDLQSDSPQIQPLDDLELASRLSYFVWSSCPDDELLALARRGALSEPQALDEQLTRMLKDDRSRGMVREFLGNWLDCRRFNGHNGVDRNEFSEFDDKLRQAMADEPFEYYLELLGRNGKLTELLHSDHMVINARLAKHYGVQEQFDAPNQLSQWFRVEEASKYQRGGLIPMAVFLTQNSPGLRTSPVKRGYWVIRKLLGEDIPPPPPNVPELPDSEHKLGDLTLRELLAQHREHPSCAACHNRFDAAGLLLEGFDPIGRPRTEDLAGRPIATDARLPNDEEAVGLDGLKAYIQANRLDDFRRHFCRSLLAFALGRSLIIPDDLLVDKMVEELKRNDDEIQSAYRVIIHSPQFLNKRAALATKELADVNQ